MSVQTFPDGTSLASSALTPAQMAAVFQTLTARIFGYPIPSTPDVNSKAYYAVRVGWQQQGQPAFKINEDTCVLTAYPENDDYSRVRDALTAVNDSADTDTLNMEYTQVWRIHWTLYGPNAYDRARLIVSSMSLDWVHDYLAAPPSPGLNPIYALASWDRPKYVPENFQGQWWQRADVDLKFNELVLEATTVSTALSATIILNTDNGQTETVVIQTN